MRGSYVDKRWCRVLAWMRAAPATWDRRHARDTARERRQPHSASRIEIASMLDDITTRAARASVYITTRHHGGTHADAVRAQNRIARKIRKVLGYTYPDQPIHF